MEELSLSCPVTQPATKYHILNGFHVLLESGPLRSPPFKCSEHQDLPQAFTCSVRKPAALVLSEGAWELGFVLFLPRLLMPSFYHSLRLNFHSREGEEFLILYVWKACSALMAQVRNPGHSRSQG